MTASAIPVEQTHVGFRPDRPPTVRQPRVAHRVPCTLAVLERGGPGGAVLSGQTVNVSAGGLAVQLGCPLEQGLAVAVVLPGRDGGRRELVGRVVRSRQVNAGTYEVGIRLDGDRPRDPV